MLSYLQTLGHAEPPRATSFVVTVYGDAVDPRGGTLWMGSLIELCAQQGLSESVVRTSVSRLVASGSLVGERVGRRSYYHLSDTARAEFHRASGILFSPIERPLGWRVALNAPKALPEGWAHVAPSVALAPDRSDIASVEGAVLTGVATTGGESWSEIASRAWDLDCVHQRYCGFVEKFDKLEADLNEGARFQGADALALRLRLVHHYRFAALRDPRLPDEGLPKGWQAARAHGLFARVYRALSDEADKHIARSCVGIDGALPVQSSKTQDRLASLALRVG